jgi:hypothetical protein
MDIRTVSRALGAVALVAGPLALAVPIVVTDNEQAAAIDQLNDYAAHSGAALVSNLLMIPLMLLVPAMIYTARLARRRAPTLAFLGGALAALGWTAGLISIGAGQIVLYQGSRLPDRAGAAALIDATTSDPVYGTLVGVFVIGHIAGMIMLGVAVWRSRVVPVWAAACFVAYPIVHFVGSATSPVLDRAANVLLLISGVALAGRLARTPDDEWDLPAVAAPANAHREPAAVA